MNRDKELIELKSAYTTLVAKQAATESMLGVLMAFIKVRPLVAEVALQKAADQEVDAMQQDGSASELLPAFLAEIDAWQAKLLNAGCMSD